MNLQNHLKTTGYYKTSVYYKETFIADTINYKIILWKTYF